MSRTFQTTDGYDVIVDEEDYYHIITMKWRSALRKRTRYAWTGSDGGWLLHRYLMTPEDDMQVDHINGNGLDCRRSNMRVVTPHQNSLNRLRDVPRDPNLTPYTGVYYKSISGKEVSERSTPWYCELKVCGKKYRRMYFKTAEEANRARNEMISQYITVL